MAQKTSGVRSLLSIPVIYKSLQNIITNNGFHRIVNEYFELKEYEILLDVGCGTGDILKYLPDNIEYFGIDLSDKYISDAKKKFNERGTFICVDFKNFDFVQIGNPDIIILIGVLHHLDDDEVTDLFKSLSTIIGDNTRFVTVDPCFIANQSFLAKLAVSMDRGQDIRMPDKLEALLKPFSSTTKMFIRSDLLSIPYNHAIVLGQLS